MKKILTLLFALCSIALSAQTTKGSFMIGGSGSLNFSNVKFSGSDPMKTYNVNLSPVAGYFIFKNFSTGLSLPLEVFWSKTTVASTSEDVSFSGCSWGVAPFVRYYIPVKSWFIVTEGTYGWYYRKSTTDVVDQNGNVTQESESSSNHRQYRIAAGPAFFLSPYTSIEILANYGRMELDKTNQSKFYVSIGLQIYLPSKK